MTQSRDLSRKERQKETRRRRAEIKGELLNVLSKVFKETNDIHAAAKATDDRVAELIKKSPQERSFLTQCVQELGRDFQTVMRMANEEQQSEIRREESVDGGEM